jgi:DNA-binding beta-propeller fold protein YncE
VTVDAASGAVYVADFAGFVWRYAPTSGTTPVSDANYTVKGIGTPGLQPCGVAVDAAGHVYASKYFEGVVKRYESSSFATSPPSLSGTEVAPLGKAIAVDPTTNELYVDQGTQITVYNPSGGQIQTFGSGTLSCGEIGSRGVAVNSATHHVYASCFYPSAIREFGYEPIPFTPVDYPAILHATRQAAKHVYGDFQVTPDGRYAIFSTTRPLLAGYDDNGHYEVYRYDSAAGEPGRIAGGLGFLPPAERPRRPRGRPRLLQHR